MPVHLPNYKHDIFLSYAHVDNQPIGWVTTLINNLKILLTKKLGSSDSFSLWMDDELHGKIATTSEIRKHIEGSATFLLILSPAYLASEWCNFELRTFLAKYGENSGRVFLVEYDYVECPDVFSDFLAYKILHNPEELEYYQEVDCLATQLLNKFSRINLFLAEVTYDLEERRNELKRYLIQQGVQVLPEYNQHSLDGDLRQSSLFVQLLSENSGYGYPRYQYERAKAAKLPILQWRDPKIQKVSESKHRAFLALTTVVAISFVDFKSMIIQQLNHVYRRSNRNQRRISST